jgi:hypothetical protein
MTIWSELRPDFKRMVARDGAHRTAERMMVNKKTVYRLITQETEDPRPLTVDAARRLIEKRQTENTNEQ